jgi:hypothetical protein
MREVCELSPNDRKPAMAKPRHSWLRSLRMVFLPGPMTPLLEGVADGLQRHARLHGHLIQSMPDDSTDVILTTAPFGEPLNWREALLLSARRRLNLGRTPAVYTMIHVPSARLQQLLDHFETALAKETPDPADYDFPGLAPLAYRVLHKQGRRGGPILALERLVQVQSKSIRALLVVGDECPNAVYHFDLVGAHPISQADDLASLYEDVVLRITTTLCCSEVTEHQVVGDPIPYHSWQSLRAPRAMCVAGQQLGKRDFFTEMVRINDLVHVPSVGDAVATQYSEGCFATWEPALGALIATVTGSARPLNKDNITEDDLAVVVGVRSDGKGALVRHIAERDNSPPSSESVEMMGMDRVLPTVTLDQAWGFSAQVPVLRSKLHGHRGIAAYDPKQVEFVPLAAPYYHYLVSCATDAQARGIREAFARSEALQDPGDPRQIVFTVLPGHGTVIGEKWVTGKAPFQVIWECMDADCLQVDSRIPQGPLEYVLAPDGKMQLKADWAASGIRSDWRFDKLLEKG